MSHWRGTQSRVNLQNSPSLHKSSVLYIGDKPATICLQKKVFGNCKKYRLTLLTSWATSAILFLGYGKGMMKWARQSGDQRAKTRKGIRSTFASTTKPWRFWTHTANRNPRKEPRGSETELGSWSLKSKKNRASAGLANLSDTLLSVQEESLANP